MGCRTGFYFLVRDMSNEDALQLIKDTIKQCAEHKGEIPGTTAIECGNYLEHDLDGALKELNKYYSLLKITRLITYSIINIGNYCLIYPVL